MIVKNRIVDLLVVGGGAAGIVGAKAASALGARTLLVEQSRMGGDCLWTGCIPSKTLLSAAEHATTVRSLTGQSPAFAAIRERIFAAISTIEPADSPAALAAAGVEFLQGAVKFRAPGVAAVNGEEIHFRQALIATGGAPMTIGLPGLDPDLVVTSDTIWELETLPATLAIVGGGPIACELGQALARLGSEVTMVVRSRILPKEDPDAAALVREALRFDGVRILEHATVVAASSTETGTRLRLGNGMEVEADSVLVAIGRTPRTADLGLERVGVDLDERAHVITDARMRTTNPLIWAAGDVTVHPQFTHLAEVHASIAVENAVLGLKQRIRTTMPRVTFTSPEVAAVGLAAAHSGPNHRILTIDHAHIDRAVAEDNTNGLTKLIVNRRGKILGGTIVGPRAGESLTELTLAVQKGMTTADLAGTTHPYPTYSDGVRHAAAAHRRERLVSPVTKQTIAALTWGRRRWLGRLTAHHRER